ncbi:hypothetical protein [Pseudomonas viridiflava]|uniref:hypothetical protein n=1 Tax=Pseudomonas viridiflava TaxID=33069 RepID=UPI0013D47A34|nr:hypothetical protein [Pseudomonas viridiflava]
MNTLQRLCTGSLAALFMLTGCTRESQIPETKHVDNGSVSFYFADQSLQCSLPFGGKVKFPESGSSDTCKELKNGGYFKLVNVPSASNIYLVSARRRESTGTNRCELDRSSSLNFKWFKLTTVKQPTNMVDKVRIEDLNTLSIPGVVVPGVRLVDAYKSGYDSDTITCAIMEVSP